MLNFKKIHKLLWALFIALQLLVGRFYDERLSFYGINISIIISSLFILYSIYGLSSCKKSTISKYLQLYLLFAFLFVFTALYFIFFKNNISNEYGLIKLFEFIYISSLIVCIILFTKDIELLKNIIFLMFSLSVLMLVIGYIISFKKGFSFNDNDRLALLGGGPIVYARWIVTGVLYFIYILNVKLIFKLIYFLLGSVLVLFSGSKGPFLALIISVFSVYIFSNLFSKAFFKSIILITISCSFFFFSLVYLNNNGLLPERMQQLTNFSKFSSATSVISRTERYPASFKIFIDNPFGVGIGNWAIYHNEKSQVKITLDDYPHNIFLELMTESGIFVFLLFIILFVISWVRVFLFYKKSNNNKQTNDKIKLRLTNFFVSFFIFTFINSNLSGDLSDNRFLFFAMSSLFVLTSTKIEDTIMENEV